MTYKDLLIRIHELLQNPVLKEYEIIFHSRIPNKLHLSGFIDTYVKVCRNDEYVMVNIHDDGSIFLSSKPKLCEYSLFNEDYKFYTIDEIVHIDYHETPILKIPQSGLPSIDSDILFQLSTSYPNFDEHYDAYIYAIENLIDVYVDVDVLAVICGDFEKALLEG